MDSSVDQHGNLKKIETVKKGLCARIYHVGELKSASSNRMTAALQNRSTSVQAVKNDPFRDFR
jgi:hypothetical protein